MKRQITNEMSKQEKEFETKLYAIEVELSQCLSKMYQLVQDPCSKGYRPFLKDAIDNFEFAMDSMAR